MEIDWFTIGAQIVNFLVLVWLLKRFLYQPVLNAIDQREKRIAAALDDAVSSKAEAAIERDALQAKSAELENQRAGLLAQAVADADAERTRLSKAARAEVEITNKQQRSALVLDAANLSAEIARRAQSEVFAISHKALADLADETLEAQLTRSFVRKLEALDKADTATVAQMLTSTRAPAVIRSAFALTSAQKARIGKAFSAALGIDAQLEFEIDADLISGIELVGGGQKLAWSVADYLKTLEKSVGDLMGRDALGTGGAT